MAALPGVLGRDVRPDSSLVGTGDPVKCHLGVPLLRAAGGPRTGHQGRGVQGPPASFLGPRVSRRAQWTLRVVQAARAGHPRGLQELRSPPPREGPSPGAKGQSFLQEPGAGLGPSGGCGPVHGLAGLVAPIPLSTENWGEGGPCTDLSQPRPTEALVIRTSRRLLREGSLWHPPHPAAWGQSS